MASSHSSGSALGTLRTLNTCGLEAIPESDAVVEPEDTFPQTCAESLCERASTHTVFMDINDNAVKDRMRMLEDRMERMSKELTAYRIEQEDAVDRLGQLTVSVAESTRKALQHFERMAISEIDTRCMAMERDLSQRWKIAQARGFSAACESEGRCVQSSDNAADAMHTEFDVALTDKAALGQASLSVAESSKTGLGQAGSSSIESSKTGLLQASFLAGSSSSKMSEFSLGQASSSLAESSKKSEAFSESLGKLSQSIVNHCNDLFDFADGTQRKKGTKEKEVLIDKYSAAASPRSINTPLAGSAEFLRRQDTSKKEAPSDEFSGAASPHSVNSPPGGSAKISSASGQKSPETATVVPEYPLRTPPAGSAEFSSVGGLESPETVTPASEYPSCMPLAGSEEFSSLSRAESPETATLTSEYPSHTGSFVSTRVRSRSADEMRSADAGCDHRSSMQLPTGSVSPKQLMLAQEFQRYDLQAETSSTSAKSPPFVPEPRCHGGSVVSAPCLPEGSLAQEHAPSGRVAKSSSEEIRAPVNPRVTVQPPPKHVCKASTLSSPRTPSVATRAQAQPSTCMSASCMQESLMNLLSPRLSLSPLGRGSAASASRSGALSLSGSAEKRVSQQFQFRTPPGGGHRASGSVLRKTMPPRLYVRSSGAQGEASGSNLPQASLSPSSGARSAPLSNPPVGTVAAHRVLPSGSPSQQTLASGHWTGQCQIPLTMASLSTAHVARSKLPRASMLSGPIPEVEVLAQPL
eukprot:TRINITY_DN1561_c0_g1_i5.p1 TRINITY_DN1561_c0_g1~~TRINITY_DN1561_c0_g1_i5.p1  ORF type:complete len:752 (+),score=101.25 TRINITY_DN1561_c0_g1_i5:183-2438(+)